MSEFLSWDEREVSGKKEIYFLTYEQIFNTEKGRQLMKELSGDFIGHSAIRFYYDLPDTTGRGRLYEKECTDFSTPENFPSVIVQAIKGGEFRGLGTPLCLLSQPALAEYAKIKQQARAEYEKIEQPAWAEYAKIKQPAWAEYEKIEQMFFWDLFANSENRAEAWK